MKISLNKNRAFTLIELLIVITIIGILAVALLPRITSGPEKARDAQRKADLQQISTALEFYADDNSGTYPWGTSPSGSDCTSTWESELENYLTDLPEDPQYDGTNGTCYQALPTSDGFLLASEIETKTSTGDGIYENGWWVASVSNSTNENLTAMEGYLCGTADCVNSTLPVWYVVAR